MRRYIDADRLKAEIDRLEEEARKVRVSGTDKEAIGADGKVSLCLKLKSLINSLQSEQLSEDLEEAARRYVTPPNALGIRTFIAGAEWQKEQKIAESSDEELVRHPPITYTYPSDASRDEQLKMALLALLNSDLIKVVGNKFTKQDLIDWVEKQKEQMNNYISKETVKRIARGSLGVQDFMRKVDEYKEDKE